MAGSRFTVIFLCHADENHNCALCTLVLPAAWNEKGDSLAIFGRPDEVWFRFSDYRGSSLLTKDVENLAASYGHEVRWVDYVGGWGYSRLLFS